MYIHVQYLISSGREVSSGRWFSGCTTILSEIRKGIVQAAYNVHVHVDSRSRLGLQTIERLTVHSAFRLQLHVALEG